ncbi:hypothetical protein DEO72_LG4g23 [Vigna unguiculata]|uniref:Uncharacterized protein n=1 Tax=Vigna unguiculata TaxID=3917 RepID=A0A4D6LL87_VIGUN|nr:hypothetical protein DEO72_LG4g23 [Vigna unguiculata]
MFTRGYDVLSWKWCRDVPNHLCLRLALIMGKEKVLTWLVVRGCLVIIMRCCRGSTINRGGVLVLRQRIHLGSEQTPAERFLSAPPQVPRSSQPCVTRDRTARPSTPRSSSPKKSRGTSSADSATDSLAALFDAQLKINQGIEVSLSSEEAEITSAIHPETVLYALNEFHARAMVMGRHLNIVLSQLPERSKLTVEIESLQRELAEANNRRQEVSLQLGNVKNERSQLLAERNLEGYVMSQHGEGFYKALRQASHYFNFDMGDERFDIDKDVYEGSVIAVEDIPVAGQQKPATSPED